MFICFYTFSLEGTKLGSALTVSRQDLQKLPQIVVETALRAPTQALPAWTGVDLGGDGYAVVKVIKVIPEKSVASGLDLKASKDRTEPVAQALSAAENLSYYNFLKSNYKAKINVASPASSVVGN